MSTKTTNDAVFTVDPEGWRQINAGRPAAQLVREAVQNSLDEAVTKVSVALNWDPNQGVGYMITDDVPGGIRDERLIFTIWMSDKTDSPRKRGRMGRGLKELIAVGDHTLILTAGGPAIEFTRHPRGRWERTSPRKHRPASGTKVAGRVKLWGKRDMDAVVDYLKRVRVPEGVELTVNGEPVARRHASEIYRLKLPTVLFEVQQDGSRAERSPRQECEVELFQESESWVYEMGIPVEAIDFPLSIDVGQRVPLREKRDTLTGAYKKELFAKLLDARMASGLIPDEQLRDNHVIVATQAPEHLSESTKRRIADVYTGGRPYSASPQSTQAATGMHIQVAPLRSLPESVRGLVKEVGTNVNEVMQNIGFAACQTISACDYTAEQRRLVEVWEWIAAGVGRRTTVHLAHGRPSALASYKRETRVLTLYTDNAGKTLLRQPLSPDALSVLIHELAHWTDPSDDNHHGFDFHSDAEHVGAEIAWWLFKNAELAAEKAGVAP